MRDSPTSPTKPKVEYFQVIFERMGVPGLYLAKLPYPESCSG